VNSKLRIRIGEVEIEYEGAEEFLKQELPQLLKTAMELHKVSGETAGGAGSKSHSHAKGGQGATLSLTTSSIAAKLNAKSGSDLLKAAAAHLALVGNSEPFSRQKLLDQMKSATSYFKTSYGANLTTYIKTALQKNGFLSEVGKDAYSMNAAARAELEKVLADA
jgi:hypothetical protein